MTSEAAAQPALLHSLGALNIWPGDRIRIVSNNASDDEEDYSGSTGVVSGIDPTKALPVFVIVDQAEEGFGAVQFGAEELEVTTPGPISTYIAALTAAQAERDALREAVGMIGAGVEIARQQGNGNAHMDTIYRITCEAMGVQS